MKGEKRDALELSEMMAEMEATIEQYRKEIDHLERKRNTLLKMNHELKEELKELIEIFSL